MTKTSLGYLALTIATVIWGTNMVVGKVLAPALGPFTMSAGRFGVAAVILLVIQFRIGGGWPRMSPTLWKLLVLAALTGISGFNPVLYAALHSVSATNVSLGFAMVPVVGAIGAWLVFREPLGMRHVLGGLVGLAGMLVLAARGQLTDIVHLDLKLGTLMFMISTVLWAVYFLIARAVREEIDALSFTTLTVLAGLPPLLVGAAVELMTHPVHVTWAEAGGIVYLGVGPTVIAFWLWTYGTQTLGGIIAGLMYSLFPLFGALLSVLILHEPFGVVQLVGSLLLAVGTLIAVARPIPPNDVQSRRAAAP